MVRVGMVNVLVVVTTLRDGDYNLYVAGGGRYFRDGYTFFRIHSRENKRKCFVFVSCSWHIC